jgi:hypothetical protein
VTVASRQGRPSIPLEAVLAIFPVALLEATNGR